MQDGMVIITKHDSPKAVLLSVDRFNSLSGIRHDSLASLTAEYDAMFKRMQSPQSQAAMQKAFRATPKLLGKAAVSAARKGA
jgi:antitoxin Phd